MSVDILLLIILGAITMVAYMIAFNSRGNKRLAVSYLIATAILVVSVWATVQYVNSGDNRRRTEEFKRLEMEKLKAEEQMRSQAAAMQMALSENNERLATASRINGIITRGSELASTIININLHDMNSELNVLLARASETKRKVEELNGEFDKMKISDTLFNQSSSIIKEAFRQLSEAAQYFVLYYRSEDSSQEELREKIMRQKATGSRDLLQKAGALIVPGISQK
jgi:hypothetical protein